ncbi:MAG: Peptidoglycan lytic exotransglycosylase [Gammaproteobacteria bacterium]|nr:Peptidoglycan lytic exotransglycosylase [Gammaproteobacteria bacterium]
MKISSCRQLFTVVVLCCFPPLVFSEDPGTGTTPDSRAINGAFLGEIVQQGALRVLYYSQLQDPRTISGVEKEMLETFAKEHHLALKWITVAAPWQLVPKLLAGTGDVIIGQGKSLAAGMSDQMIFTSSWTASRQQIVVRKDTTQITRLDDLT